MKQNCSYVPRYVTVAKYVPAATVFLFFFFFSHIYICICDFSLSNSIFLTFDNVGVERQGRKKSTLTSNVHLLFTNYYIYIYVCVLFKMHLSVSLCFSRNVKVDFECHGAAIYPLKRRRRYLHFPLSKRKVASLSIFVFFHAFCATLP